VLGLKRILNEIPITFRKGRMWLAAQRSRRLASRSEGFVFLFAAASGLISGIIALSAKEAFPYYEKLIGFWPTMPFKIKVATLLVTIMLLTWSAIGFSFGLLCAFYSKELMRRLES
jgi:hypothetical protein